MSQASVANGIGICVGISQIRLGFFNDCRQALRWLGLILDKSCNIDPIYVSISTFLQLEIDLKILKMLFL